ncbi:MAG: hypothetical protein ACTSWW_07040 [Promethearchaeota archaeon]
MSEKKINNTAGFILAILGAVLGLGLNLKYFLDVYKLYIETQIELFFPLTNFQVIEYVLPFFVGMAMLAGAMYLVSAYGFLNKRPWAYAVATIGNVIAVQFSFWPMIPAMDMGLNPVFLWVFLPNGIIFLLLHTLVGKRSGGQVILGLVAGMTLVTSWINGTAALNMSWMFVEGSPQIASSSFVDNSLFILANPLHWIVAFSFGTICVMILLKPEKEWIRMLGLGVAVLELVLGIPMGIEATVRKSEFSLYLAAPAFVTVLLIFFISPKLWNKTLKIDKEE